MIQMLPGRKFIEDEQSEATMVFSAQSLAEFRRMAPLQKERNAEPRWKTPLASTIKKKLDFDLSVDSFLFEPPNLPGVKTRIAESEFEIDILRKKLDDKDRKIQQLEHQCEKERETVIQFRSEISRLNLEKKNDDIDRKNQSSLNESILNRTAIDDWRSVAEKYIVWYKTAFNQLSTAVGILKNGNLMSTCNMNKLLDAGHLTPINLTEEDLDDHIRGSIQEYVGLSAAICDTISKEENDECETAGSFFREPSPIVQDSADVSFSCLDESSVLNNALMNTTIDFEKDEKIDRLEVENANLKDKLQLASGRASSYLLLKEQHRGLEERCRLIEQQLNSTVSELEALRAASANRMFDLPDVNTQHRAVEMTDRIKRMQMRITQLERQLGGVEIERDQLHSQLSLSSGEKIRFKEELSRAQGENETLKIAVADSGRKIESATALLENCNSEWSSRLKQADNTISMLKTTISELSNQGLNPKHIEPTDAGDTTQIVHMEANPLQVAHDQYKQEEQQRKRKADDDEDQTQAKRVKEDELEILRSRLIASEKSKEAALGLQADFTKRYREITTVLTGYQIKVKDISEGICYVNNVYDDGDSQFIFKCSDSGRVDLLDVGQGALSQGRPWNDEMRKYIGERQSVPAFLASVVLALESRRDVDVVHDESMLERTHAFSILHRDT